jgi:hypothetical protein
MASILANRISPGVQPSEHTLQLGRTAGPEARQQLRPDVDDRVEGRLQRGL